MQTKYAKSMFPSPISDLNPIFLAAGCSLEVASAKGTRQVSATNVAGTR